MNARTRIATVGFIATAVTFGPGRMAYGMFLPQLKETFGFSSGTAGSIAGFAFAAFFLALLLTSWITAKLGTRIPVLIGGITATAGFTLTAFAPDLITMSIGIALASASAGFAWTPFNSMAEQVVPEHFQKRTLSIVSTGTTFGIIAAGLLALAVSISGQPWNIAWMVFAGTGLFVALVPMLILLRDKNFNQSTGIAYRTTFRRLAARRALPLYGFALSFGATNGVYLSYWIDHISSAGGLSGISTELIGPVLLVVFGLAGCIGLTTGDVEDKIGLRALLFGLFTGSTISMLLLAFLPTSWVGTALSAALQGVCLMALSAVYAFWSERLFPDLPSVSFTAVLLVYAAGNVVAPPIAGFMSEPLGLGMTLAIFGAISLLSLPLIKGVEEV